MSDDRQPIQDVSKVTQAEAKSGGLSAGAVIALIGLALFIAFMFQNRADTSINFMGWSGTVPLWLLASAVFIVGALVGYYAKAQRVRKKRKAAVAKAKAG